MEDISSNNDVSMAEEPGSSTNTTAERKQELNSETKEDSKPENTVDVSNKEKFDSGINVATQSATTQGPANDTISKEEAVKKTKESIEQVRNCTRLVYLTKIFSPLYRL